MQAREMIKIIKRDNLVENAAKVGGYLFVQLEEMQASGSGKGKMSNLRGKGCVLDSSITKPVLSI